MIIIALKNPRQQDYLMQVLDAYTRNGIPAGELPLAADVYIAVASAQSLPTEHLGKATVAGIGPNGIALEVEPSKNDPNDQTLYEQ